MTRAITDLDPYREMARQMLEEKLLNHPDEGVVAITALCGVPEEAVEAVASKLRAQIADLEALPDSEIDTSDIPETTDWTGATRGKFAKGGDA